MTTNSPFARGNSGWDQVDHKWPPDEKLIEEKPRLEVYELMGKNPANAVPVNDRVQQVLLALLIAFAVYCMTRFMDDHDKLTKHDTTLTQLENSQSAVVAELREIRNLLQRKQ